MDFNYRPVGDAPLAVARAQANLVDLPHPGSDRAPALRTALREAYVDDRERSVTDYFDYFATFRRGIDREAVDA